MEKEINERTIKAKAEKENLEKIINERTEEFFKEKEKEKEKKEKEKKEKEKEREKEKEKEKKEVNLK